MAMYQKILAALDHTDTDHLSVISKSDQHADIAAVTIGRNHVEDEGAGFAVQAGTVHRALGGGAQRRFSREGQGIG